MRVQSIFVIIIAIFLIKILGLLPFIEQIWQAFITAVGQLAKTSNGH